VTTEEARITATRLALAALALVAFAPHLGGDFVWDDRAYIFDDPRMYRADGIRDLLTQPFALGGTAYRPVSTVTFWMQVRAFGMSLAPLRALNVLVHVGVVQLLFAALRRASLSWPAAAAGAALFAVHPGATEVVMFVNARHDGLGALLALSALLAWTADAPLRRRAPAGAALFALALGCKESLVALPALLAAVQAAGERTRPRDALRAVGLQLALSGATIASFFAWRAHLHIASSSDQMRAGLGAQAVVVASVLAHYGGLALRFAQAPAAQSWRPLGAAASLGVGALLAALLPPLWRWRRRDPPRAEAAAFGVAWFVAFVAPNALVIPSTGQFANRYLYMPLLGHALVLAALLHALLAGRHRRLVAVGVGALLLVCAAVSSAQASRWRTGLALFGADLEEHPADARQIYHYAVYVARLRGCGRALPMFERAAALEPTYVRAWHNVAGCLLQLRRYGEAVAPALRAYRLAPDDPRNLLNLGVALAASGDAARGLPAIARACRSLPADPVCARR
jgi:tetratricopeptide (TPR) repeat protein